MATQAGTAVAVPASIFRGTLRATTVAIVIIITLIAFEAMAVNAAMPTAARDLHGLAYYGWAFTGLMAANIVGMVVSGLWCDTVGPRRSLAAGLVCFAAGLVLAGTATSMVQFLSGRVVQGLGSGLLITAIYVLIGETFPQSLQPKVFAATSSAWVLPALLGPLVSGGLTQHVGWRWVFLGLLPFVLIGAALLIPTLRRLSRPVADGRAPTDQRRIALALAVAAGIALVQNAGQHHTMTWIGFGVLGIVVLAWGLHGLLPPGAARVRPGVAAPVALRGVLSGAFFGLDTTIPLMMTVQHGYSPILAGLPLAAGGITWSIGSYLQGRPSRRPEEQRRILLLRSGFVLVACAAVLVGIGQQPSAPGWVVYLAWTISGFGMGLAMSSTSVLLLRYTTDAERGANSAALQLSDSTGAALTSGFSGVLVATAVAGTIGYTGAFWTLALTLSAVALLGATVAGRARSKA